MKLPEKIRLPLSNNNPLDLNKSLMDYSYLLSQILNGGIKLQDNLNAQIKTVASTGAANTEFTVSHTLGRVPSGYIIISNSGAGYVYNGTTAWTATAIYLRHSAINAAITVLIT